MKLHDHKPLVNYSEQPTYRNPIIRWLMGETKPTDAELVLGGIAMGLLIVKFVWELTA